MLLKQNKFRKILSFLLVLAVLITSVYVMPVSSYAETTTVTKTGQVDFDDLAYYDIWKHEDGTWQNGIKQGSSVSKAYTISETDKVPLGVTITAISGSFNTSYSDGSNKKYSVTSGAAYGVTYEFPVGTVKATQSASLSYTVSTVLTTKEGLNGANIKEPWQAPNVEGWRYFIPVTFHIEYEYAETVPVIDEPAPEENAPEDMTAGVNAPKTAKTGESFTVTDGTFVGAETIVNNSLLYRTVDNKNKELIATWIGGTKGKNTGGSISQTFSEPCTVTYEIVVTTEKGQKKTATAKTTIEDGRVMSGNAILEVEPQITYETQPVYAEDVSNFKVDDTNYSAKRAYAEDIARNNYKATGGTITKDGNNAIVIYPKSGIYPITLTTTILSTGKTFTATKNVEVRKTPYINDTLGGFQKQNRKQILTFIIATSKGNPITGYNIAIKDLTTNEIISLTNDTPQKNGACIKTRTVAKEVTNEYWTTLTVEFLTKYPSYDKTGDETRRFSYKIKVTDSKGDTDDVYKEFDVAPDMPPTALISMQDSFIRNAGTNTASIQASDVSTSDGDQLERTWAVAVHNTITGLAAGQSNAQASIPTESFINATTLSGYQNLAFGTNQTIGFNKEGVGKTTVKMQVKDVWVEPTLEEYISPSDYLQAETTATTEVINVAPVVSVDLLNTLKTNISILVPEDKEDTIKNQLNTLNASLIEKGIDGNINIVPVTPAYSGNTYKTGSFTVDKALWSEINTSGKSRTYITAPIQKFTAWGNEYASQIKIEAYNTSGNAVWSYPLPYFNFVDGLYADNKEKYLVASCYTKNATSWAKEQTYSLILDAKTGTFLKKIDNISLNAEMFISADNNRLYFVQPDGIYKLDINSGVYSKVTSLTGVLPRLVNGKIGFVGKVSDSKYYIGMFDMTTEKTDSAIAPILEYTTFNIKEGGSIISVRDWDKDGNILLSRAIYDAFNMQNQGGEVWVVNTKTSTQTHTLNLACEDSGGWTVFLVKDKNGVSKYFATASMYKTSKIYNFINVYSITGTTNQTPAYSINTASLTIANSGYHDNDTNKITFISEGYYGDCWVLNLNNGAWEVAGSSISGLGIDPISDNFHHFNGKFTTFHNGFGDGAFYKTAITLDDSALNELKDRVDFYANPVNDNPDNYVINYGNIGDLSKTESCVSDNGGQIIPMQAIDSFSLIADKVKEASTTAKKYALNIIGNATDRVGFAAKYDNPPLKLNTEYNFSYDMDVISGAAVNVLTPTINQTITQAYSGTVHYDEPVYQADLQNGFINNAEDGTVTYAEGGWINGSHTYPAGYGGVISVNMAQDGYADIVIVATSSYHNLYVDGAIHQQNLGGQYYLQKKVSLFLNKGLHTIEMKSLYYPEYRYYGLIQSISVGYYSTVNNPFYNIKSSINPNLKSQTVTGTFITPKLPKYTVTSSMTVSEMDLTQAYDSGILSRESWMAMFYGRNIYYQNYYSNTRYAWITITAPSDKIVVASSDKFHQIVMPNQSYTYGMYVSRNSWNVLLTSFSIAVIPVTTTTTTSDTYVFGVGGQSVDYPVPTTFNLVKMQDGSATVERCQTIPTTVSTGIVLGTSLSGNVLLNAMISNLKITAINQEKNLQGTILAERFSNEDSLSAHSWTTYAVGSAKAEMKLEEDDDETAPLVYKKGQLVAYNINYSDHENDPSKSGYWLYAHTPFNDGSHPDGAIIYDADGNIISVCGQTIQAGTINIDEALIIAKSNGLKILTAPINKFYVDGKYTVYHWEYDDTSRGTVAGGYSAYDKSSNTEELTFYIDGAASAPWVTGISISPTKVTEDNYFSINIGIDDTEKDILNLTTEVYKDKKLIYTHRKKNILPIDSAGNSTNNPAIAVGYPVINTGALPDKAQAGTYEVVATVRDQSGVGLGAYKFIVVSEGKVTGYVNHTDNWEENRKKYNLSWFDSEVNTAYSYADYLAQTERRKRGTNVFWSGEKFMLRAAIAGSPTKVLCSINGTSYNSTMSSTGTKNADGEIIYTGLMWNDDMINKWGMKKPEQLTFTFTATYSEETAKTHNATVIVDDMNPYWRLHRAF